MKENVSRYLRRGMIGLLAGLISSLALALTLGDKLFGVILGVLVGVGYGLAFLPAPAANLDSLITAAALGVPLWTILSMILSMSPWVSLKPTSVWRCRSFAKCLKARIGER